MASFFVSRVDTAVDRRLEAIARTEALALRGTTAVANARLAYRRYQELFEGDDFAGQQRQGARPQRLLWASTGTKKPAHSDVLYVQKLIGRNKSTPYLLQPWILSWTTVKSAARH